jgi:hypothetical protein
MRNILIVITNAVTGVMIMIRALIVREIARVDALVLAVIKLSFSYSNYNLAQNII